jgi:hypothetical protein
MAEIEVIVEPIASEDINWSDGSKQSAETFTRTTSTGGEQVVHKISALTIPLEDQTTWPPFEVTTVEELISGWLAGTAPIINKTQMLQVRMSLLNELAGLIGVNSLDQVITELPWGFCPSMHPVGTILPWMPGYFEGENADFVRASFLAPKISEPSLVAACNTFLSTGGPGGSDLGWRVCDGTAPNLATSPIWNAPGKYLPLLTDERFLMGVDGPVTIGEGEEWEEEVWAAGFNGHHVHGLQPVTMDANDLPHKHDLTAAVGSLMAGVDWTTMSTDPITDGREYTHDHGLGGANQVMSFEDELLNGTSWESLGSGEKEMQGIDNRPKWLGVIYIIRVF